VKIILPLSVVLPRKTKADKVFILNLNIYRNAHYMTLNNAKVAWVEIVKAVLVLTDQTMPDPPYRFTYTVFPANNRKFDLGNVCSIIDKFTADALQEMGVIQDDSFKYIPEIVFRFCGDDKTNPRVELEIEGMP